MLRNAIRQRHTVHSWLKTTSWLAQTDLGASPKAPDAASQPTNQISNVHVKLTSSAVKTSALNLRNEGFNSGLEIAGNEEDDDESLLRTNSQQYVAQLNRCIREKSIDEGVAIYDHIRSRHIRFDLRLYTAAMKLFGRRRERDPVQALFLEMIQNRILPDIYALNTYIFALGQSGDYRQAKGVFETMEMKYGIEPNAVTYRCLMISAGNARNREKATDIFNAVQLKFGPELLNYDSLIDAYSEATDSAIGSGDLATGVEILKQLKANGFKPGYHTYISLIRLASRAGNLNSAMQYLEDLTTDYVPTFTAYEAIMECLMKMAGVTNEDFKYRMVYLMRHAMNQQRKPTRSTVETIIKVFGHRGDASQAFEIFVKLCLERMPGQRSYQAPALICLDILTANGYYTAHEALSRIPAVVSQNSELGRDMSIDGCKSWLNICCKAGDYERAMECFTLAAKRNLPLVDAEMVEMMIRLVLEQGNLQRTLDLFEFACQLKIRLKLVHFKLVFDRLREKGDVETARVLYQRMHEQNLKPDKTIHECLVALKLR